MNLYRAKSWLTDYLQMSLGLGLFFAHQLVLEEVEFDQSFIEMKLVWKLVNQTKLSAWFYFSFDVDRREG